jgi:hypothetical protein
VLALKEERRASIASTADGSTAADGEGERDDGMGGWE